MLRTVTILLAVMALALNLCAAKDKKYNNRKDRKQSRISYYTVENAPEAMELRLKHNESITFLLEENPTTGYVWEASYDRKRCKVDLKQRAAKANKVGAPGMVEVKIKLRTNRDATVELAYRRPFEKGKKPVKVIRCHIVNSRYRGKQHEPENTAGINTGKTKESKRKK